MIKKTLSFLLCLFTTLAYSAEQLPDSFSVQQGKQCSTNKDCVVLIDNHKQIFGSLRSDPFVYNVYYYFNADMQQQLMIKKTREEIIGSPDSGLIQTIFEFYDSNQTLIAQLTFYHHVMGLAYQVFFLETPDHQTLIRSLPYLGHLGTKTGIYNDYLNTEVARIYRPLFSLSLDSQIKILNKPQLLAAIDPTIFATILALYSNKALFYQNFQIYESYYVSKKTLYALRLKVQNTAEYLGIDLHNRPTTEKEMQTAEQILIDHYNALYGDNVSSKHVDRINREEKLIQVVDLVVDLIYANKLSVDQQKIVLYFLNDRLLNHPNS